MPDIFFQLLHFLQWIASPAFERAADSFLHGASTYFFMALFVPSFVVIISVVLYFVIYFLITLAAATVVNAVSALGSLHLAVRLLIVAAAPAGAYGVFRLWKRRAALPPSGPAASLSRLDRSREPIYGAKAASLGELSSAGLRIPFGYAFSSSIFKAYVRNNAIELPGGFDKYDDDFEHALHVVRDAIRKGRFPIGAWLLLRAAHLALWLRGGMDPSFIVRSSFVGEDAPGRLAPGQYGSFGARGFRGMLRAVRACWCTYYTERAYMYREKMGTPHEPELSFIAQVQLRMDLIGTAAGANPATGYREELVVDISAPPEDPYAVSEQSDAETIIYNIAENFPRPPEDPRFPFLAELAAGLRAAQARCDGAPVAEWAYCRGRLYFLQLRPMAGLPIVDTYISSGMVEIAGERLSPMALSMIRSVRSLDSFITEPVARYMEKPVAGGDILAVAGGRVYARFEALASLEESMKPDLREIREFMKLCGEEAAEIKKCILDVEAELARARGLNAESAGTEELIAAFRRMNETINGRGAGGQAMAAHLAQVLVALLERLLGAAGVPPENVRALPMYEKGCAALRRAELLKGIAAGGGSAPGLINEYINKFGYLAPADEIDPSVPRISEAPEEFAKSLGGAAATEESVDEKKEKKEDGKEKTPAKHLRAAMRGHCGANLAPWDTYLLRRIYALAMEYSTLREELRYKLLEGWALARRMLFSLASREPYASALDDPGLIFFFEAGELEPAAARDAAGKAKQRREEYARQENNTKRDVIHINEAGEILDEEAARPAQAADGVLQGRAASTGKATGTARLIVRPEDADRLAEGDIAVVESCSPWMSILFARAAGAVALSGGVVSHLALAAREYGVPMVVGVRGVAGEDLEGATLEVDTAAECVRILKDTD